MRWTPLVHDVIADAAIALSDMTFFGLAMLCLLLLERSTQTGGFAAMLMIMGAPALAAGAFDLDDWHRVFVNGIRGSLRLQHRTATARQHPRPTRRAASLLR